MKPDLKILILEDSPADAALLERELRRSELSFTSRRVETRTDFIVGLDQFAPDLVIADYKLPGFDGMQALAIVRSRSPLLPFILASGYVGEDRAVEALKAGATDFILKDRLGRLASCIQRALQDAEDRARHTRLQERFRLFFEAAPGALVMVRAGGCIEMLNRQTEEMFGYKRADLLGRSIETLIPTKFRTQHTELLASFFAKGTTSALGTRPEMVGLRSDGSEFPVEVGLNPIETEDGTMVLAVIMDITARREIEQAKERHRQQLEELGRLQTEARKQAENASLAKSRFLAGMSHELRTPLNGILGYAQLLRMEGDLNATQAERVGAMLAAGKHLLDMITSVLDLSKIETEHVELQASALDVQGLVKECLAVMRPAAEAKHLRLDNVVAADAPPRIVTDSTRFRQVLVNLIGNAVKYTERGGVEVRLRPAADAQAALRIEVADTGPGIPVARRSQLFHEFERFDNATSAGIEGAGLGLALSNRLVTLLGGQLNYADNPGGGSVFWFELPSNMAVSSSASVPAHTPDPEPASPLRVLVVDDAAMNRDIVASMLRSKGHAVDCVEGGAESVAAVTSTAYDVVLMDVRMPKMDGLEATRRIRALGGPHARVPIVALTAQAFTEQIAECSEAGMDHHLAKPFDAAALFAVVARATRRAEATT